MGQAQSIGYTFSTKKARKNASQPLRFSPEYRIIDSFLCGRGGIGRRARFRFWWVTVQVQVLSPAPKMEGQSSGLAFHFYGKRQDLKSPVAADSAASCALRNSTEQVERKRDLARCEFCASETRPSKSSNVRLGSSVPNANLSLRIPRRVALLRNTTGLAGRSETWLAASCTHVQLDRVSRT